MLPAVVAIVSGILRDTPNSATRSSATRDLVNLGSAARVPTGVRRPSLSKRRGDHSLNALLPKPRALLALLAIITRSNTRAGAANSFASTPAIAWVLVCRQRALLPTRKRRKP